jgi:poly(hydroxyalkanoate) granule-associated protein
MQTEDQQLLERIKGSANKIWLAGLGAFAHADREGKDGETMFENLVKEGEAVQAQTLGKIQQVKTRANDKIDEVREFATETTDRIQDKFDEVRTRTRDQLENRIRSLRNNFSSNIQNDIDRLTKQVRELSDAVRRVSPNARPGRKDDGEASNKD